MTFTLSEPKDPVSPSVKFIFYALHVADVWTTMEGMKYDCVVEANPLLPRIPHRDRLILHKLFFLQPFDMLFQQEALTNDDMVFPVAVAAYVVYSNLDVIDRAEQRCNLR